MQVVQVLRVVLVPVVMEVMEEAAELLLLEEDLVAMVPQETDKAEAEEEVVIQPLVEELRS